MNAPAKVDVLCGYSCFECGESSPDGTTRQEVEESAYYDGWVLGLSDDAQAHYACADCSVLLFSATPAWPLHWNAEQRAAADKAQAVRHG